MAADYMPSSRLLKANNDDDKYKDAIGMEKRVNNSKRFF